MFPGDDFLHSWADATLDRAECGVKDDESELESEEGMSLMERLLRLHVHESSRESRVCSHVSPCRNLLSELLVRLPSLPRLRLESDSKGFLSLKTFISGTERVLLDSLSTEDPLMEYFENQELPPLLLGVLEPQLWIEGCVLAEVRLLPSASKHQTLLLRPSTQSLISDSNLIAAGWSPVDKSSLEGELALLLSGPLCLDPSPVVSLIARKSLHQRQKLNTVPLKRLLRKRRWIQPQEQQEQPLLDFIRASRRAKGGPAPEETLAKHQASLRTSLRNGGGLFFHGTGGSSGQAPPLVTDVSKRARTIQKRAEMNDMTPHIVEEYILETAERSMAHVYHTRLTIYQRLANDEYLGELYVERDYRENDNKGSTCRFILGTQPHALRYINQFTEIFTEEGRKSVKITHRVPNQPPRVTYTPGMRERLSERDKILVKNNNNNNNNTTSTAAVFNAISKQQQQVVGHTPTTRIIQFNNASGANHNHNNNNNNNHLTTPSILQTQLQRNNNNNNAGNKGSLESKSSSSSSQPIEFVPVFPSDDSSAQAAAAASLASQQQQQKDLEISAIKQALMKEGAEFEANKSSSSSCSSSSAKTFAQLPTRPVPVASLAEHPNPPASSSLKATSNPKLVSKQLSLHKILNAQAVQQQQITISGNTAVKVSQLSRPVISAGTLGQGALPSYSQAQQQQQNSIKSKLVVTPSQATKALKTFGHDAPGLQALLANTPSADSPGSSNAAVPTGTAVSVGSTLLERLVSEQAIVTTCASVSSPLTAPSPHSSSSDSTNDITLAALLAKPASGGGGGGTNNNSVVNTSQTTIYSTKMSPLLQQLQQPVRTTVRQSPHLSPRLISSSSSPRPQQQQFANTHSKSLNTVPTSTMITLPVQEAVNGFNDASGSAAAQNANVVSLQNLLQSGVVNNSGGAGGGPGSIVTSSSSSIPVQLSIQGLPSPVTLSVNLAAEGTGGNHATLDTGGSSSPNVFVTHSAGQGAQKVNLPKIVTSGNQTVLFQSPGNIIQLPQQQQNMKTPVVTSQIKTVSSGSPLLQVRPGQPLFLQVPNSQNKNTGQIQIVRTQSLVRPSSGGLQTSSSSQQQQQVVINSLKSPSVVVGGGKPASISPQGLLSPSPSSSIPASPQHLSESNLVAIQLQQQQQQQQLSSPVVSQEQTQQLILTAPQQKQSISQIKVRQQRKQTLK